MRFLKKKFDVIMADPAWLYRDKAVAGKRGAEFQYPCLTVDQIKSLEVKSIAKDDSTLFLWSTFPMLSEALSVMNVWGFEYKTNAFTWIKTTIDGFGLKWGMGNYTRANAEVCLLGIRGRPKRVDAGVHSVIQSVPGRHSEKPKEARERIERLFGDVDRIELFAREKVPGWYCWGDEVKSDIQLD